MFILVASVISQHFVLSRELKCPSQKKPVCHVSSMKILKVNFSCIILKRWYLFLSAFYNSKSAVRL